ncbi:MAG: magnesium transporter CorA family protein [Bacteroidota bacterium]|jgi:magnesium transporter
MLTIYKTTEQGLEQIESIANGAWVKVIDPTPAEIEKLADWGIDLDYINYSLDFDELPRMERDEDYTFILIRIPHSQPEGDIPYTTIPLGIMIKSNFIVTICRYDKDLFKVLTEGKYRNLKTAKRYRLALYIFLETATRYLAHLREINHATEAIEDKLQKSTRNRELLELLKYQKSLTFFATALRSNEVMMERVQRTQIFNYYEEDQDLLEDVLTENQQAIQMTNINTEILSSMTDAFASIISNNINAVMKVLAALTIIINLPLLVASFYGMNVSLPGAEREHAFLLVVGLAVGLTAAAIYIFYKQDWF